MRFADRPCPMHQHQAGAKPVEEGLSGFWQMSTAFNGSQHANPRSSATRFIGKRANSPQWRETPLHSRANSVRSHANRAPRLNCRGAPRRSAHKTKAKNKISVRFARKLRLGGPSTNCTWRKTAILALKRGDLPENPKLMSPQSSAIAIFLQTRAKNCCGSGAES